jgi:hypothetical protein
VVALSTPMAAKVANCFSSALRRCCTSVICQS